MRPSLTFSRVQLLYVPLLAVTALLQFSKNFLYAKFLPVVQFGTLVQYVLAGSLVASWCGLGFGLLAHKLLPMHYAAGRERDAARFLGAASYVFMLVLGVVVVCAALVGSILPSYRIATVVGGVVVVLVASSQYAFQLCLIDIKSRLDFIGYARTSVIRALAVIFVGVAAAKATGSAAAVLCCDAVVTLGLVASLKAGASVRSGLADSSFGDIVRQLRSAGAVAIRLLWLSTTVSVLYSLDRWAGVALLTKEQFGLYALALSILAGFDTVQLVANVSIYPIMANFIGRGHSYAAFRLAATATAGTAALGAILYGPGAWLFKTVIGSFLPSYAAAGVLIPIAMVVGCLRMADFLTSFVILSDRETASAASLTALGVVCAAGLWWVARIEHVVVTPQGLAWFAVAVASAALCISFTISMVIVWRKTPKRRAGTPA